MTSYLKRAHAALGYYRKGFIPPVIWRAWPDLKARSAADIRRMIWIAEKDEMNQSHALTAEELRLIRNVAASEREALAQGDICAPKLKYCSNYLWGRGKAERIARKRLNTHRKGEDEREPGTGLGLLNAYGGGYVRLTRAGWALVHALEASEGDG